MTWPTDWKEMKNKKIEIAINVLMINILRFNLQIKIEILKSPNFKSILVIDFLIRVCL
jgi:hypothetical protein